MKITQRLLNFFIVSLLIGLYACGGSVLKNATPLKAEVVPDNVVCEETGHCIVEPPNCPVGETCNPVVQEPEPVLNEIFNGPPGQWYRLNNAGPIDSKSTTIDLDFDGDGLNNLDETLANMWVADYPVISPSVVPPITMRIEVLDTSNQTKERVTSEIDSTEKRETSQWGLKKANHWEHGIRTERYEHSFNEARSGQRPNSDATLANAGLGLADFAVGLGVSAIGAAAGVPLPGAGPLDTGGVVMENWSKSYGETTTKWKDVPYKDKSFETDWSRDQGGSKDKERKFRKDLNVAKTGTKLIQPDAGIIRAAMYIKNLSVNMPVKISNILATFMLETPKGQLIPMKTFRLRNDDYSLFEIEIYGGDTFGPYVIELENLNTREIRKAIRSGKVPKVFIIDYQMRHVQDSNYKQALGNNFSGENLKIIEENAKGRTANVAIMLPGKINQHRVAAFDTDATEETCFDPSGVTQVTPGVSLEKALRRIACNGYSVEFADIIVDLSGLEPTMETPVHHFRAIKSINGLQMRLPGSDNLEDHLVTDLDDGSQAYYFRPTTYWTAEDYAKARRWRVFADGRFFAEGRAITDNNVVQTFRFNSPVHGQEITAIKMEGISSTVWAGDHYEVMMTSLADHKEVVENSTGTDPIESEEGVALDTFWNDSSIGERPYYPEVNSTYLGQALLGEKIQLKFKLIDSTFLNPSFTVSSLGNGIGLTDFDYDNFENEGLKFNLEEVLDFEISLGTGGDASDWHHILHDVGGGVENFADCGQMVDYQAQEFTQCLTLPTEHPYLGENDPANLYLRASLSQAHRERIWVRPDSQIHRFVAKTKSLVEFDSNTLRVKSASGVLDVSDTLRLYNKYGSFTSHSISAISDLTGGEYTIELSAPVGQEYPPFTEVAVHSGESYNPVNLTISNAFATNWNLAGNLLNLIDNGTPTCATGSGYNTYLFQSYRCLGYEFDNIAVLEQLLGPDWIGFNWGDAGRLNAESGLFPFNETSYPALYSEETNGGSHFSIAQTDDVVFSDNNYVSHNFLHSFTEEGTGKNFLIYKREQADTSFEVVAQEIDLVAEDYSVATTVLASFPSGHAAGAGIHVFSSNTATGVRHLIAWQDGTAIEGIFADMTGNPTPTTATLYDESYTIEHFQIDGFADTDAALLSVVVHDTFKKYKIRSVDLTNSANLGAISIIAGLTNQVMNNIILSNPSETAFGIKGILTFQYEASTGERNLRIRILNEDYSVAATLDNATDHVDQINSPRPVCWDSGPRCFISFGFVAATNEYYGIFVDTVAETVGDDIYLGASDSANQNSTIVNYSSGNVAAIRYVTEAGPNKVGYRQIDFATQSLVEPSSGGEYLTSDVVHPYGGVRETNNLLGRTMVVYKGSGILNASIYDWPTNRFYGARNIPISTYNASNWYKTVRFGNTVLVLYETDNSNLTTNTAIVASRLSLNDMWEFPYGKNHFFAAPLVRRSYVLYANLLDD